MVVRSAARPLTASENQYWRDYGYHRSETVLRNLPEIFAIESTNYCNLQCIMCPRGEPDVMTRPLGHMGTALFEKILDEAVFFCSPCWLHWFGEPLMNPKLFEQIEVAKKKVPNLGISTNATLLTEEKTNALLDSGIDTVMIAIDGATADVYERVRKSPTFTFEEVTANAEHFLAAKRSRKTNTPRVILSIITMKETEQELEQFRAHWIARGANRINIKLLTTWGAQTSDFIDLATDAKRATLGRPRPFPCKALWSSLVVTWDGRVVPCCFDYDAKMVMGDLKTSSLAEIWNSPAYVEARRAELEGRNDSPLCANCSEAPGHERDSNWGASDSAKSKSGSGFWRRWLSSSSPSVIQDP